MVALGLGYDMRDLIPWPGMEPRPPALGAWILSHWTTREVPPIQSSVAPPTRQETPMASKQPNPGAGFLLWCLKTWLTAQFSWLCLFVTCGLFNTHFPCRLHCKAFLSWFSSFCSDHYFWVPLISSILSFNHFLFSVTLVTESHGRTHTWSFTLVNWNAPIVSFAKTPSSPAITFWLYLALYPLILPQLHCPSSHRMLTFITKQLKLQN